MTDKVQFVLRIVFTLVILLAVPIAASVPSTALAQDSARIPRFYIPVDGLGEGILSGDNSPYHYNADDYALDYYYYDQSPQTDHEGQPYLPTQGMTIWPTLPGRVVFSGYDQNYGYVVVLRHMDYSKWDKIYYSVYAHLEAKGRPRVGQLLSASTPVGGMDMTGQGGNEIVHLHFAVRSSDVMMTGTDALYGVNQSPFDVRPYMW